MKIVKLSQTEDREAWLQMRIGKITGSKSKQLKPLSRGTDRTPQGFWQLLAEKLAVAPDGEKDMDRGQRLEKDALEILAAKENLDINLDPGMWVSDDSDDLAVSPDGSENTDTPTWAAEVKCLSSANHLKHVIKDSRARAKEEYSPIHHVPDDAKSAYREQVVQYFVVNEKLQRLYFVLYDDRIALDKYMHHVIVIERSQIEAEIAEQKRTQLETLAEINNLIEELKRV